MFAWRHALSSTLILTLAIAPTMPATRLSATEVLLLVKKEATTLRLVYQLGDSELPSAPDQRYASWHAFEMRGLSERHDPHLSGCVSEVADLTLPRIRVRDDYQIFAYTTVAGDGSGLAAVGPWGLRPLLAETGAGALPRENGSFLAPEGGALGVALGNGEIVVVDLGASKPSLKKVRLPVTAKDVDAESLTLSLDSGFFSARDFDNDWRVYRFSLADSSPLASEIAGPFAEIGRYMAHSRGAVAFLAGADKDEYDIFVATASGLARKVTSSPAEYIEHRPTDPKLAISDDGLFVASNQDIGSEPEVFIHDLNAAAPAVSTHVTEDARFNPYIDQDSFIFFVRADLFFAAGHSQAASDLFRVSPTNTETVNLTQTGSQLLPPFLTTGQLDFDAIVIAEGERVLATATNEPGTTETLYLLSPQTGEIQVAIPDLSRASDFITLGEAPSGELYFKVLDTNGLWTLYRQTASGFEAILATTRTEPRMLLHDAERAFYSLAGLGLLELGLARTPRVVVFSGDVAEAALTRTEESLVLRVIDEGSTGFYSLHLASGVVTPIQIDLDSSDVLLAAGLPSGFFLRGDVNQDLWFDLSDAVAALLFIFRGTAEVLCEDAADANDDGSINLADPNFILQSLFKHGPSPFQPFPALGLDPSEDALDCAGS